MKIKNQRSKTKGLNFALTVLVSVLIYGCATESTPMGGPEDKEPPKIKQVTPADKSTLFNERKIEIQFDEFLQAGGFAQTIISPPVEPKPDIRSNGKTVTIKFKEDLKENTTYTINFGDDIKDLNQGNVLPNFTYVFSTGDYIDSQQVSGVVTNAKTGEPAESIIVMLHSPDSINPILHTKPIYFSKTNAGGMYSIKNIKAGKYQVYGLKDANFNYLYDQPSEAIAFADTLLDLTDSVPQKLDLLSFNEIKKNLKFQNVKSLEAGKLILTYSGSVQSLKLQGEAFKNGLQYWKYSTNDTVIVWYSDYYIKNSEFIITANDTVVDTMRLELKNIDKVSVEQLSKYNLSIVNQSITKRALSDSSKNSNAQALYGSLKIELSRPITEIDESKRLQIMADSSTKDTINPSWKLDTIRRQEISFDFARKEKTGYTLIIPDSMFRDVFGLWNKALTWKFTTASKDSYGNIKLKLNVADVSKRYVVRFMDSKDEEVAVYQMYGENVRNEKLNNVPATTYHVEVIEDTNGNGKWDTGDLLQRIQPEKVIRFKDTYTLKGGWDLDVEVKF